MEKENMERLNYCFKKNILQANTDTRKKKITSLKKSDYT